MEKYEIIKLKKKGWSNSKVQKETGYARGTIRKYWKEYQEKQEQLTDGTPKDRDVIESLITESKYDSSNRGPRKYTPEVDAALKKILKDEEIKTQRLGKTHKQALTKKQIFELIVEQGFDVGRSTVYNHINIILDAKKEAFIKQEYEYCDRFEYDFGEVKLYINGILRKYYLAVITAPASGFRWAYLYTNMKMEVFLDSHARFFEMVGGSFKEGVYDNCRCVVSKFIGRNEKELNKDLIKLAMYYDYEINVTNCFSGNEKGTVESAVKWIRNKVFALKYEFNCIEDAYEYLENQLEIINKDSKIQEEMKYLKPYRPKYESATISCNFVNKYSFIRVDNNFYSVPEDLCEKYVDVKLYPNTVLASYKGKVVAQHERLAGKEKTCIDIRHYLHTFSQKPGSLKNSLALKSYPELKKLFDKYYSEKPKTFIEILRENKDLPIEELLTLLDPIRVSTNDQKLVDKRTDEQIQLIEQLFVGGKHYVH